MNQPPSGLTGLRFDLRRLFFAHYRHFGAADLSQLPKQGLGRRPLFGIKNQGFTSFCPWYSTAAGREYQEGVELSPEAQALLGSKVARYSILGGADAEDALKTLIKYGSVEQSKFPTHLSDQPADYFANPANVAPELEAEGKKHLAQAFFTAHNGPYDAFDNIRSALALGKAENQVVYVAGRWYQSWNVSGLRKVIRECTGATSLHMYVYADWTQLEDTEVLVLQNSYGTATGDQGLQYLSREAVNKSFAYNSIFERLFGPRLGAFIVRDMPADALAATKASVPFSIATAIMNIINFATTTKPVVPPPAPVPTPPPAPAPVVHTNADKLYKAAVAFLDRDASPQDKVSDDVACVESVDDVWLAAFGSRLTRPEHYSTARLKVNCDTDPRLRKIGLTEEPAKGDILLYATGQGNFPHGHVMIVGKNKAPDGTLWLMGNNSDDGKWKADYSIASAATYWGKKGGFPRHVYRPLG